MIPPSGVLSEDVPKPAVGLENVVTLRKPTSMVLLCGTAAIVEPVPDLASKLGVERRGIERMGVRRTGRQKD